MKTRIYIIALLSGMTILASAQPGTSRPFSPPLMQSTSTLETGKAYKGTVYEPFNNSVPSEQSEVGKQYAPSKNGNGPRRLGNFDDVPEGGEQEQSYPIGDAVIPLMALALAFGGITYLRKRKATDK